MRTIYKYKLNRFGETTLYMPDAQIIHIALQGDDLCLWVAWATKDKFVNRTFYIFGTGETFPEDTDQVFYEHMETIMDGASVWHIYENWE